MEELKKIVSAKAGISDEQANTAVLAVSDYIKSRIPSVLHSQMDKILSGEDIEDSIRNKAESIGNEIKERAGDLGNDLKQAFDKAFKSNKTGNPG